MTTCTRL